MSCQSFGIISIPALLFKRGGHFVARFLHFCCRWREKRTARGGFARSGALGLPRAGHVVQSGVLCVGYSSDGILRRSIMGYAAVLLISLTRECDSITNLPTFAEYLPIFCLQVCRCVVC